MSSSCKKKNNYTFITEWQQHGKQIKFQVGTVTIISCCSYWKGKQRHSNAGKTDLRSTIFHFLDFILFFGFSRWFVLYFKLHITITCSEDTSLTCHSLNQRAKMWFAIMYWIDSCLYDQSIFMVITIVLKPKPEAGLDFLLKKELRSLCMKSYSRASFLYLK